MKFEPKKNQERGAAMGESSGLNAAALTKQEIGEIILFSVLFFAGITILNVFSTLVLTLLALLSCVGKKAWGRFRALWSIPLIGMFLLALSTFAASIYTPMDQSAVSELCIFMTPFALLVIMLTRFERKHMRGLMAGIITVIALVAILSADIATGEWLFTPFNAMMHLLGSDFDPVIGNSAGGRMNGLYNDANITGSMFAMAYFVGLYLYRSEPSKRKKGAWVVLLGINLSGMLLSASRGAMLCFGIACLVYLAVECESRLQLFLLLVESAVAVVVTGFPASRLVLAQSEAAILLMFACGLLFWGMDVLLGVRLSEALSAHKKLAVGLSASVIALAAIYLVVGVSVTGDYVFSEVGSKVFLLPDAPGAYTLSGEYDGTVCSVLVYSQDLVQRDRSESTILYLGTLEDCSYEIPAGATEAHILVRALEGTTLKSITVSDGTKVKLSYPLLPKLISERLYDKLLGGNSVNMRLQFDKDAWKLFTEKPLLGYGLNSTEGFYMKVQPFFYQSRYAHNHLLQVMSDQGLLGTIPALIMMLGCGWLVLKAVLKRKNALAAAMVAVWVMMNLHSLIEINFSVRPYRAFAYLLLGVILLCATEERGVNWKRKSVDPGTVLCGAVAAYLALFFVLCTSHVVVQNRVVRFETESMDEYEAFLRHNIAFDVFDREEMMLSYVAYVDVDRNPARAAYQEKCVERLRNYGTYTALTGLSHYYYMPRWNLKMAAKYSIAGIEQRQSYADAWDSELRGYRDMLFPAVREDTVDMFMDAVLEIVGALEQFNESGRMEQIVLAEDVQLFLDQITDVHSQGLTGADAYLVLSAMI